MDHQRLLGIRIRRLGFGLLVAGLLALLILLVVDLRASAGTDAAPGPTAAVAPEALARVASRSPRWLTASGEPVPGAAATVAQVSKSYTFPSGARMDAYLGKARYRPGEPIVAYTTLTRPDGTPIVGRRDAIILLQQDDGQPFKPNTGLLEYSLNPPGVYELHTEPLAARPSQIKVLVIQPDPGVEPSPDGSGNPPHQQTLELVTEYGSAGLNPRAIRGELSNGRLRVHVGVLAQGAARGAVRAELRDGDRPLGETTMVVDLREGGNDVVLDFGEVVRADAPPADLRLADATLFLGERLDWADFLADPVPVPLGLPATR